MALNFLNVHDYEASMLLVFTLKLQLIYCEVAFVVVYGHYTVGSDACSIPLTTLSSRSSRRSPS